MSEQQLFSHPGTHFVEMPCLDTDSQANLRSEVIIISPLTAQEAVSKFLKNEKYIAHYELATTYTLGYEGQEKHIWDFSHYEVYEPTNNRLPSIVILRYRRRHFKEISEQDTETALAV
ncbi:MAG: hypothetical protein V7L29_02410 [Nostoc sp.]|uniref:hypothetical protein n=1 Tax=Nostoc sp. TaxID=1180 RepID=UPI002FFACF0D